MAKRTISLEVELPDNIDQAILNAAANQLSTARVGPIGG